MKRYLLIIVCFLVLTAQVYSAEKINFSKNQLMKPLDVKNQYIFYLPYLYMPAEKAKVMDKNENELKFSFYKGSTFLDHYVMLQQGIMDVETTTVSFQYSIGIGNGWELRMYAPFIYLGPGYLDPLIENFHHALGLPNGGKETWYNNRMNIEWKPGNISITEAYYGFGDPALFAKKELLSGNPVISSVLALKVPSGAKPFISSNTFDLGASFQFEYYGDRGYIYGNIGGTVFLGESFYEKELSRTKNFSIDWGFGIGLRLSDTVAVFMQLYQQTSPYSMGVDRIDTVSTIHSFGVRWQPVRNFVIQFSADEDTFTYTGTDISFNLQTEYRF